LLQILLPVLFLVLAGAMLFIEGKKPRDFAEKLSLQPIPAKKLFPDSLKLFAKAFIILYLLVTILSLLGIADAEKVAETVKRQDSLTLLAAVSLGPFAEEVLFRGYLQKRIGVIITSLLFAFLHKGYGSVAEIAAAFAVSVIFGHYVRENNSVLPPFLAHALYNAMSVVAATRI